MKQNRRMIIFIVGLSLTIFGFGMITYSFFNTSIKGDNVEAEIDIGTMSLKFSDGNPTIDEQIMVGETITKTFTIENTGDLDASLSIEWLNIVNTYMEGSLTYTVEQSEIQDSGYTEVISKTNVPVTDTAFTTTLAPDLEIPEGKTYYYNLKITFNDLEGIDQETDRNAKLTTKFTVSQPSNNRSYSLVIDPNGGTLGDINTVQTLTKRNGTTETIGTPTKVGADFKGWKVVGYESTLVDGTLTIGKSNTKVIAEWGKSESSKIVEKLGVTVNPSSDTVPNFASVATGEEGVYALEDDYGTSYFYRGAVKNNYVKFGKWAPNTTKAEKDMYWRIIRVNGDGSVRIKYDGTKAYANGTNTADRFTHTEQVWNANYNDNKYVGWMYGPTGTTHSTSKQQAQTNAADSNIKKVVDTWYKTNIVDQGYEENVADVIFCNDRSTPGKDATGYSSDTGLGYGTNRTGYGAYARFNNGMGTQNYAPIFKCLQKQDAFTVSDVKNGNGALTYPVGLITADEVIAAGGKWSTVNSLYYLYNPNNWSWTLSPWVLGDTEYARMFDINGTNSYLSLHCFDVNGKGTVSPVINLTADYFKTLIGDGTMENPFRAEGLEP